uniref:Activity-regulated cytoskeleton associated protein 1-like n=1 Tax=Diabrotica virgifera virgifera TaxID=50390 RepID=A0A6P7GMQ9_DIAVI
MTTITMSADQFNELLRTVAASPGTNNSSGSFSKCTARFSGKRCHNTVETFITTVSIYKEIEKISEADALKGLPLLLTDNAAVWWQGVQNEAKTWNDATQLLRTAFSPSKPAHQVYVDIFNNKQQSNETIDEFVTQKRALLAQLPLNRHDEQTQLDLIYGLLSLHIRKEVPRDKITTFSELLDKGRQCEEIRKEAIPDKGIDEKQGTSTKRKPARCGFCHFKGHTTDVCRKRQTKENEKHPGTDKAPDTQNSMKELPQTNNGIICYGCGKAGYYRSNCPVCTASRPNVNTQAVNFYSFNTLQSLSTQVPTIPITVQGIRGIAHIDTAARTSVAGRSLYECLKKTPSVIFKKSEATVTLADGSNQMQELLSTTVEIDIETRTFQINFIVLPNASDNRTHTTKVLVFC